MYDHGVGFVCRRIKLANFLIVDDEPGVRATYAALVQGGGHTVKTAENIKKARKAVVNSESSEGEPFDLILMDYDLGGATGLEAIQAINDKMGNEYCEHRIVVITGHRNQVLPGQFAELGSIAFLNKPIAEDQFWSTINLCLKRREIFYNKKQDWEEALKLLDELGVLEGIESLKDVSEQYETLKEIYENLLEDLRKAGIRENQVAQAYETATQSLNESSTKFESIFPFLQRYGYTKNFIDDVKDVFRSERLQFFILQSYLQRISENPNAYRVKKLNTTGEHYEYRIGRSFRLYFRRGAGEKLILERYGSKSLQVKILNFLSDHLVPDISEEPIL